jgi:uncharacterized protein (TIGR02588 family)
VARGKDSGRTTPERVTTGVCILLLTLLCAAILWEGYGKGEAEPAFIAVEIQSDEAEQVEDGWHVPFTIRNEGDATVEEVLVTIEGSRGGEVAVTRETTVALLGEGESVDGMMVFDEDPAELEFDGAAESFQLAEEA